MSDQDAVIEYPLDLPVKIIGREGEAFRATALAILRRHFPEVQPQSLQQRPSRAGNYVAFTVQLRAECREQLDALYTELSAAEDVLWVL